MTDKEIAIRLIQNALATQRADAEDYTEPNSDPSLKPLGNAAIANHLERLGGRGIVVDVQPTITQHGMGFVYRIDPELLHELSNEERISRLVNALFEGPPSETASTLAALLENCERVTINHIYRESPCKHSRAAGLFQPRVLYRLPRAGWKDSGDLSEASID